MNLTLQRMSDCDYLAYLLRQGRPLTTTAIRYRSAQDRGVELVVNSRAAELRKRGVPVRCKRDGSYVNGRGKYVYWIEDES